MLTKFHDVVEKGRVRGGPYSTQPGSPYGAFLLKNPSGEVFKIVASDGGDWQECGFPPPAFEHVSVSLETRCPTWGEMCWVKKLFWGPGETVIQYHPPEDDYVNFHPFCLHLFRPVGVEIPRPPKECVG